MSTIVIIQPGQTNTTPGSPQEAREWKQACRLADEVPAAVKDMIELVLPLDNEPCDKNDLPGTVVLCDKRAGLLRRLSGTLQFHPNHCAPQFMTMDSKSRFVGKDYRYGYTQDADLEKFTLTTTKHFGNGVPSHTYSCRVTLQKSTGARAVEMEDGLDLIEFDASWARISGGLPRPGAPFTTSAAAAATPAPPPPPPPATALPVSAEDKRKLGEQLLAEAALQEQRAAARVETVQGGLLIQGISIPVKQL